MFGFLRLETGLARAALLHPFPFTCRFHRHAFSSTFRDPSARSYCHGSTPQDVFPTSPQNLFEGSHPKASKRPFERLREIHSKGPKVRTSAAKSYEATLHMTLRYCASKRSAKIADLFVVLRLRFSFGSGKKSPTFVGIAIFLDQNLCVPETPPRFLHDFMGCQTSFSDENI